jgi:branched-chain amino acid transport system ATP-binding protein
LLKLENVETKYFNVVLALKGVSIELPERKVYAVLGANGSGKSTLLKSISGLLDIEEGRITDGNVYFENRLLNNLEPADIFQLGITQVMEGRRILEHLTVEQNLKLGAAMRTDTPGIKQDWDLVHDCFPKLKLLKHQVAGYLSGGEQQMLVIGRALMSRPKLLLLDEPSLGLAPLIIHDIFAVLKRLNRDGLTMLIVEQNVKAALSIADYGYILETGRVVLEGSSGELLENQDVREFYLGLSLSGERKSYHDVKHYKRRKRWLG